MAAMLDSNGSGIEPDGSAFGQAEGTMAFALFDKFCDQISPEFSGALQGC